mgnify:CR=1 FL=1
MKKIGIVMGSDSDLPIVTKATDTLKALDIPFEVHVYSAHRTPVEARDFAVNARENGFGAIIAAAGMAAHLAGAFAGNSTLPVIGIPMKGGAMDGLDALLATVQMPTGIPVATVAVDGGANAALLAAQILAVEDSVLAEKLNNKRASDAKKVLEKDAAADGLEFARRVAHLTRVVRLLRVGIPFLVDGELGLQRGQLLLRHALRHVRVRPVRERDDFLGRRRRHRDGVPLRGRGRQDSKQTQDLDPKHGLRPFLSQTR